MRDMNYVSNRAYALQFVDNETGEPEVHLTKQSDKDFTDVNHIIARYKKTGLIDHVARGVAQYGDFTSVNEYQESLNRVIRANDSFMALPAAVRAKFDNDAGLFFEYVTNPANHAELVQMGLANAKPETLDQSLLDVTGLSDTNVKLVS